MASQLASLMTKAIPTAVLACMHGVCYWEAVYIGGRIIREADGVDWMNLPKRGLVDLRLIAPDGQGVGFGNTVEATGRLFQFKGGLLRASVGAGGVQSGRQRTFHLIGMIKDTGGRCVCFSYEHDQQPPRWVGPFEDNFHGMLYRQIGPINSALLGSSA